MLLSVLDKDSAAQVIITNAQEANVDHSGSIAATGVSQEAVAANSLRSGLFIQNLSETYPLYFNVGVDAVSGAGSIKILPGERMHFPNEFPISTGAVNILGTVSESFTIKEW